MLSMTAARRSHNIRRWIQTWLLAGLLFGLAGESLGGDPVALRITSLPVTPAHMPGVKVWVKNLADQPYAGLLSLELPDGWNADPERQEISLAPRSTGEARFTIRNGKTLPENRYTLAALARGAGQEVRRAQEVVCASAPYFKPEIDGKVDDWNDAIPVTFITKGKKTTISTSWNRRQFSILVAVEEDSLAPPRDGRPCDAVQIAISPQGAETGTDPGAAATRHEFLLAAGGAGEQGRCFLLAQPGMKLEETQMDRDLAGLEFSESPAVTRQGDTTFYEWAVSFKSLAEIRPGEGREFFLSVLVHDPGGTGLRDWGEAAGLWPDQRNPLAWSRWRGADWPVAPPMDNKVEWGMCSSKY